MNFILVIGLNRSGTKWLSNLLAQHSQIAAVTLPEHFGIVESNVFNDYSRIFGSLQRDDDYAAFVNLWAETDFVKSLNVPRREILDWQPRPSNVFHAFERLMNDYLVSGDKPIWLQKCNPVQAVRAIPDFSEDGKVVVIRRPLFSVVESSAALNQSAGLKNSFFKDAFVMAVQDRVLDRFWNDGNCLNVSFEKLKTDTGAEMSRICDAIGLEFESEMLETPFQQNTSFKQKQRYDLSVMQKLIVGTLKTGLKLLPVSVALKIWKTSRANKPFSSISGTYRSAFGGSDENACVNSE